MREIKFRAWDKVEKIYWTQDEMNNIGGFYYIFGVSPDEDEFDLQQYTGLKDKNGKEIYEVDIVKDNNDKIFEVVYGGQYNYCGFGIQRLREDNEVGSRPYTWDTLNDTWGNSLEIIGNIYENPELLKVDNG